ncbi:MAG: 2-oxoacid:acceptor oxidoreductase family protein [Desulfobacterales bacterium]|nr:2-oxoacid:acceptor oxidoreductase family protein [Desulfobacterales bacterium]
MRREIMFAGFGGQGIVKAALLTAQAAGLFQGKKIAQSQSYGPEARGGACKSEVVISDREIAYIKTRSLDALVVMSQPALDQYAPRIQPGRTRVIHDNTLVHDLPSGLIDPVGVSATALAEEKLGRSLFANIIMLGALAGATDMVSLDALSRALDGNVPPATLETNRRALELGFRATGAEAH